MHFSIFQRWQVGITPTNIGKENKGLEMESKEIQQSV